MATKWISPTWRMPEESNQSKFENYSLDFDGINDVVQIARSADLEPANITVSCWVNVTATGSHTSGYFVSKIHTSGASASYGIYKPATPTFLINIGGVLKYSPAYGTDIQGQGWHHLVGTYDGAHIRLYVNGTEVGSGTAETGSIDYTTEDAYIGSFEPSSLEIDGEINQTIIYNSALTSAQITALYNSGTPVNPMALTPAPIAYYPLGSGSTGDAAVVSPSTLTVPNESVPSATVFDFNNSNINVGDIDNAGALSFSTWLSTTSTNASSYQNIAWKRNGSTGWFMQYLYGSGTNGKIKFYIFHTNGSGTGSEVTITNLQSGDWFNIALTYDGTDAVGALKLYSNGTEVYSNSSTLGGTGIAINNDDLYFGGSASSAFFTCKLSNIQLWDTGLSAPNVTTLYNNGVPYTGTQPQAANLKAWYKLNVDTSTWNGSDWIIGDSTANYDKSFNFESSNNDVICADTVMETGPLNSIAGSITVSAWCKTTAGTVYKYLVNKNRTTAAVFNSPFTLTKDNFYGGGGRMIWSVNNTNGDLCQVRLTGSTDPAGNPLITMNDGLWHHIVGVYDTSTDTCSLYTDGVLQGTTTTAGISDFPLPTAYPASRTCIGGVNNGSMVPSSLTGAWDGGISNVQIWDMALDAGNVTTLFNGGTPLTTNIESSNLKGSYKLDGTEVWTGSTWEIKNQADLSTSTLTKGLVESSRVDGLVSANAGTSSGMTTANLVNSDLTRSIPYSSYSMVFDGLTEDIRCGNSLGSSLSQAEYVTVSCWVYFNDITEEQGLWNFRSGDNTNDVGTSLSLYSSGTVLRLAYYEGGNNGYVTISNPGFSNENWYNITCVYDKGAAGKIYINGQAQTVVDSGVYSTVDFSSDNFYIGSYYSSTYSTNGNLSNIAVWNSELTSDQVLTVYNGGVPKDISNLSPTRWWSLAGDSYFDGNDFICPNLTSISNNGTSYNLGSTDLVGNGPGSTANGIATSMNIPENLKGNAPNSSKNAFSINMTEIDRVSGISTVSITSAGTGYIVSNFISTTGGSGSGCVVNIDSVGGSGDITGISIYQGGNNYAIGDVLTISGGGGNATITVSSLSVPG